MSFNFPIKAGLEIQAQQLKVWKEVLKPEVYTNIEQQVQQKNATSRYTSGCDVFRGDDITSLVLNYQRPTVKPQSNS